MNDDIMRALGFDKEVDRTKLGLCPTCGNPVKMEDFKDDISRREFGIGGMCQACQDSIFE
jgi:hypothetical protein